MSNPKGGRPMNPQAASTSAVELGDTSPSQDESALLRDAAPEMLAKLKKVVDWLDAMAASEDANERTYRGRFDSIADQCVKDAKNWRATAADLRKTIAKADPGWGGKPNGHRRSNNRNEDS